MFLVEIILFNVSVVVIKHFQNTIIKTKKENIYLVIRILQVGIIQISDHGLRLLRVTGEYMYLIIILLQKISLYQNID
jgi:hypothetical protein